MNAVLVQSREQVETSLVRSKYVICDDSSSRANPDQKCHFESDYRLPGRPPFNARALFSAEQLHVNQNQVDSLRPSVISTKRERQ